MRAPSSQYACAAAVLMLMLSPLSAAGQGARQVQVNLQADRHIASVGEQLRVTVAIVITGRMGYDRYIPPSFAGFTVTQGGMTTQNIEVINWKVRRRESHTYTVAPAREGMLRIGPASVVLHGRKINSQVVTIKVRKGSTPAPPTPSPSPTPAPDPSSSPMPAPQGTRPLGRVFLSAVAIPTKVYLGQQVVVTWYLYTQSDVLGFQPAQQPKTDKFWSEDLKSPRRLAFERQMVQDQLYYAAVITRKALFPQQTGELTIGPMSARVRTLDQFSGPAVNRQSAAVSVEVQPLPEDGKPAGFPESNVGHYDVMGSIDRVSVKAGEGVTLKVVIRGSGNLRQVKPPVIDEMDGFKVYKPKVVDNLTFEGGVQGEKVVEYLLLPVRSGRLQIPALHLDYFDPEAGSYKRASTTPLPLQVTGKMPAAVGAGAATAKNVIGPTIRPPRPARALTHRPASRLYRSPVFLGLLLLPVALIVLITGGERLKARMMRQTPRSLRRAASRRAQRHMKQAEELRRKGDHAGFYAELAAGLRSVLDHRLDASIEGLTRAELRERMLGSGYPAPMAEEVAEQLDSCDIARFAPTGESESGVEMDQVLQRIRDLLDRLARISVRVKEGE